MNILVANSSYQKIRFQYQVPGHPKNFRVDIHAGSQVRLAPGDFSEAQKAYIIKQLERYGGVPASEVHSLSIITPGVSPIRRPLVILG